MSENIFINFSNHPSDRWSNEQKKAALNYGEIIDIPFPSVDSNGDESYIKETGNKMIERIMSYHLGSIVSGRVYVGVLYNFRINEKWNYRVSCV